MAIDIDNLWKEYAETRSVALRNKLVEENMGIVRNVARHYVDHHPKHTLLEYDDLVQAGAIGLIQAVERFDLERGIRFTAYSWIRILGNIIDYAESVTKVDAVSIADIDSIQQRPCPPEYQAEDDLLFHGSGLSERSKQVLVMRYVHDMQLKAIGAAIGVSESRVSQILESCRQWIKSRFENEAQSSGLSRKARP